MSDELNDPATRSGFKLERLLVAAGLPPLNKLLIPKFNAYLSLLIRWNSRINLTAVRSEDEILSRHFVESIACAISLPAGISTLLDFGSGAGFPGIPIALCRPEIKTTLAESQAKKAAFLREAVRVLELSAVVHDARAETLASAFDCVTLRAVDHMNLAIGSASRLVRPGGWLVPLTTVAEQSAIRSEAGPAFTWDDAISIPHSEQRVILIGRQEGIAHGSRE